MEIEIRNKETFSKVKEVKMNLRKIRFNEYQGSIMVILKDGSTPTMVGDHSRFDYLDRYGFIIK